MRRLISPDPVKLIIGFIFKDKEFLIKAQKILCSRFGKIDYESVILSFAYTDYYQKEFGDNLKRKFISFQRLIPSEHLAAIKNFTNKVEIKFSEKNLRKINIDPGYLTMAKLVLASIKDYSHRVYLNKNIFAEITLFYQNKNFHPREWTYPDYRSAEYIQIFSQIRELYARQI